MNYQEYREKRQKEFDELPIFYAFNDKQFEEALAERGLTLNNLDQLYKLPAGGFYLKKDHEKIKAFFEQPDQLPELMKNFDFAESAFYYEMCNHEYIYNWEADYDVISCFAKITYTGDTSDHERRDYFEQAGWGPETIKAYRAALVRYAADCEKYGWG